MNISDFDKKIITHEASFKTFIISGPGGQNLHKSSTGADLTWDFASSNISPFLRSKILESLEKKNLNETTKFQFKSQVHRSLDLNKKEAYKKLFEFLDKLLFVPKKRIATKPSYSSKQKKINAKKIKGEIKKNRQKINY